METIIYILILVAILLPIGYKSYSISKSKSKSNITKKRIDNINNHLRIADASNNLHEVRVHARKAMKLINKYGLLEEYRKIFNNK